MDERELLRAFQELTEALAEAERQEKILGQVSSQTASSISALQAKVTGLQAKVGSTTGSLGALAQASQEATKAELDASEATKAYAQGVKTSAKNVASSAGQLAGGLASGADSFGQFTGITQSVGAVLSKLANIPGLETASASVNFFISQLDSVAKAYGELGRVGAITAEGVEGLRKQFDRLGLVNLPEFVAAVKQSSLGLAALGPTVSRGARQFGDSLGQITDKDGPFVGGLFALGYNLEEIASTAGTFAATQALSGNRQIRTTEQLTQATVKYLREITELADATGRSRQQVVEERKKSEADARFQARLQTLREEGNDAAADELQRLVDSVGGPIADIIRASVTGVPLTEQATKAFPLIGPAVLEAIAAIERGARAEDVRSQLIREGIANQKDLNTNIQYSAEAFGTDTVNQLRRFGQMFRDGQDPFDMARRNREAAEAAGGVTKQFTDAQISVANLSREFQRLAIDGLTPATIAVQLFTGTLTSVIAVADAALKSTPNLPFKMPQPPPGTSPGIGVYPDIDINMKPDASGRGRRIPGMQTGGIFHDRAGMAILHGPEAVVPLPDGKTIPVQVSFQDMQRAVMASNGVEASPAAGMKELQLAVQASKEVGAEAAAGFKTLQQAAIRSEVASAAVSLKEALQAVQIAGAGAANPLTGVSAGPVTTDLNLIKELAAQLGAFDKSAQVITNPETWSKIVASGLATNLSVQGLAGDRVNFGGRSNPELSATISTELAKLTAEGSPLEASLQKIASDYGRAMQTAMDQFRQQQMGAMAGPELQEMVNLLRQSNATQTRILQAANN